MTNAFEDLVDAKRILREIKMLSKLILTHLKCPVHSHALHSRLGSFASFGIVFRRPPFANLEKKKYGVTNVNFNAIQPEFFDHENIISLHDVQKPESKTGYNDIYIVTDLMETDLHRVIYSK